jgi:hypothetical protein
MDGLVHLDSHKRDFRKIFLYRDLLTKSEMRHEEETRNGYPTALSDAVTTHQNSELWKVLQ